MTPKLSPPTAKKSHKDSTSIISISQAGGQLYKLSSLIIGRYLTLEKLINAIKAKQLTECLEILEKAGYTGELATFILKLVNLQNFGGAS